MKHAVFVEVTNPFDVVKSMKVHKEVPGMTVRQWLEKRFGKGFKDFDQPTVCSVNGKWTLRESWDKIRVWAGDVVQFITNPGYEAIFYIVVLIIAVVLAIVLTPKPVVPGEEAAAEPVYTLQGQYNRFRAGQPIEVAYGRNRLWPSYAANPYNRYINHEQHQYIVLCLGQGYYDEATMVVQVEDTSIDNFPDVDWEIIQPGGAVTLFDDNVTTSVEVGNLELLATDDTNYPAGGGWFGPYTLNPAKTVTALLEVDIVCPNGLYFMVDGIPVNTDIQFEFSARLIDDAGAALGGWTLLEAATLTENTLEPQRFTRTYVVASGRYEIRGRRVNAKGGSPARMTQTHWQAARAYLAPVTAYDGVTLLALKIRATNSLNDQSRSRFNVIATRKLPVWDSEDGVWLDAPEDLAPTQSPVMAFCDAFRANYGGMLDDDYLDMDELMAMDAKFTTLGITFDWVFDSRSTLLEIARAICRVGRCVPMMAGSRLFMVRDEEVETPIGMFTPDVMVTDSFRREVKLFEFDRTDSVLVEYVDPVSFEPSELLFTLPGGTTLNPERLKLPGCTSETVAYREAAYVASVQRYARERVSFRTGMEGMIPAYGDLVAVSHDVPQWGTSGVVTEILLASGSTRVRVSEPLTFVDGTTYSVMLRDRYGAPQGPYAATVGADSFEMVLAVELDDTQYAIGPDYDPPVFSFGPTGSETRLFKVVMIKPSGGEEVEIECVPYLPVVYAYDDATPP